MIVYLSRNGRNLKLLLLFYYYYFIPIYVATEHKSHSNLMIRTYKPEDNLNMNKTWVKCTRFSIWIIPHWRRIQTSLLDPAPLGTVIFRCHAVIYLSIGRCESRTRYFRDGKLIIGAAKLIDLDNYIKIFRGYFTIYISTHRHFFFSTRTFQFESKCTFKVMSRLMIKPIKWSLRPAKTHISLGVRRVRS